MNTAAAVSPQPVPVPALVAEPLTVMVTGSGGRLGSQLVHQLRARGMRVIRTDITPCLPPGVDFVLGPYGACPSYIPFLEVTIARLQVDLLLPTVPDELPILAAAAPMLNSRVAIAGPGAVTLCHDRLLLMRYLARHRIPVPITVTVRPSGVPRKLMGERPYVVRPRLANADGGMRRISARDRLPARNDTFVAQELVPGEEHLAQVHRSVRDGWTTVVLLRRDPDGGLERLAPAADPEVEVLVRETVHALDLTGSCGITVRRDADGHPMVLGVDPRPGPCVELVPEQVDGLLADAVTS